jgi:hypothetical protein
MVVWYTSLAGVSMALWLLYGMQTRGQANPAVHAQRTKDMSEINGLINVSISPVNYQFDTLVDSGRVLFLNVVILIFTCIVSYPCRLYKGDKLKIREKTPND